MVSIVIIRTLHRIHTDRNNYDEVQTIGTQSVYADEKFIDFLGFQNVQVVPRCFSFYGPCPISPSEIHARVTLRPSEDQTYFFIVLTYQYVQ